MGSEHPGTTYLDAEHIAVPMQENRSLDPRSEKSTRSARTQRSARNSVRSWNSVFVQTDVAGTTYAPWRLDIKDTRVTWMGSIPHTR